MPTGVSPTGKRFSRIRRDWLDQVNESLNSREPYGWRPGPVAGPAPGIIPVRNTTGATIPRFGILGIDAPVIDAGDNAEAFVSIAGFDGVTPTAFDHALKFVVALEPIADGGFGDCVHTGLVVAKVDIRSSYHTHAGIRTSGGPPTLWSEFGGPGRIVSQEAGTGEKYCLLDLQPSAGPWLVEGIMLTAVEAGVENAGKLEASVHSLQVWQRDSAHDLATDTGETVPVYNVSDTTVAPDNAYAIASFDGFTWRQIWLDCAGSALGA